VQQRLQPNQELNQELNPSTVYIKSFEGENFHSSSLKLNNMWGKLSRLRTLCFAANPKTIHTHGLSVYGVLELENHVTFQHLHYSRRNKRILN